MTPTVTSKLPGVGTTIFTIMSSLAAEHKAINLGQGFPDFPMDNELIDLVAEAMRNGHNQYVHMNGLPILRERLSEKINFLYNNAVHPDREITITPGGTYAIYCALTAILHPGDEVIYFEPAYDSYAPNILINQAVPVPVKLQYPDYHINWDDVSKKVTSKTRAIIINSPHNPTGSVLSEDDIAGLRRIVKDTDIFIVSDEVYEHLIFDDKPHHSMLMYPDLYDRSFVCFSFGKIYHCTGWKMGYCVAPPPLTEEFRKVHQFNCFTCNTPVQHGLAAYIAQSEHYNNLGKMLQAKRDHLLKRMEETRFSPLPSYGSYFQLYSYKEISDKPELEFAKQLTKENGVATIPVSAFYSEANDNRVLRFCFAKKEETLDAAVEKLKSI